MAKLKIITFPNPILAQKAMPIDHIDKALFPLADAMLETMYEAPGIGLAANQVGVLKRMLVLDIDYTHTEEDMLLPSEHIVNKKPLIIINPEIIYHEGLQTYNEGCLSVPDFRHDVIRSQRIRLQYKTIEGRSKTLEAEDLLAVVIQHEMDHLNGKLFIDRIGIKDARTIRKSLRKKEK